VLAAGSEGGIEDDLRSFEERKFLSRRAEVSSYSSAWRKAGVVFKTIGALLSAHECPCSAWIAASGRRLSHPAFSSLTPLLAFQRFD
jgi:hypothetical protein